MYVMLLGATTASCGCGNVVLVAGVVSPVKLDSSTDKSTAYNII